MQNSGLQIVAGLTRPLRFNIVNFGDIGTQTNILVRSIIFKFLSLSLTSRFHFIPRMTSLKG